MWAGKLKFRECFQKEGGPDHVSGLPTSAKEISASLPIPAAS